MQETVAKAQVAAKSAPTLKGGGGGHSTVGSALKETGITIPPKPPEEGPWEKGLKNIPKKKAAGGEKASEEAAKKAAAKMSAWTDVIGSSIGAVGGFTAAISGFDMSSPEAAMSSIMALGFAVSQAQSAISAFATVTKLGAAAEDG